MQDLQLLWVGAALRVHGDRVWFDLTVCFVCVLPRHREPWAEELGWGLCPCPTWVAPGDAQTKQLYIPRWQRSPVPLLAPALGKQPAGALGNNFVNVYFCVLYCKPATRLT